MIFSQCSEATLLFVLAFNLIASEPDPTLRTLGVLPGITPAVELLLDFATLFMLSGTESGLIGLLVPDDLVTIPCD